MQFRTSFSIPPFEPKITHDSRLFAMGSCFSEMIGEKLAERKFKVLHNPFGTIFNPLSLFLLLEKSLSETPLEEALILEQQERFYHYQTHSKLSATSKEQLMELLLHQQQAAKKVLSEASHIFITFGTAFIYDLQQSEIPVANCHKQPNSLFRKRLLHPDEMLEGFRSFQTLLNQVNPEANIIVTVSPVRHTKDGIPENQLSKSMLRVFCHQLQENFRQVVYFPSYELMMDDLRDYRFYKEDMIHPTSQAENYIWDQFQACFMEAKTLETSKTILEIKNALNHQPFHAKSPAHQRFLQNLLLKMERLVPEIDFSKEISEVKSRLKPNNNTA